MRTELGLETTRRSGHRNFRREPVRIYFPLFGKENHVCESLRRDFGAVQFEIPGIALKILRRSELSRIDENSYHHPLAAICRFGDEREMGSMQSAHGGNQSDAR